MATFPRAPERLSTQPTPLEPLPAAEYQVQATRSPSVPTAST